MTDLDRVANLADTLADVLLHDPTDETEDDLEEFACLLESVRLSAGGS
jgi:hypothetical protein